TEGLAKAGSYRAFRVDFQMAEGLGGMAAIAFYSPDTAAPDVRNARISSTWARSALFPVGPSSGTDLLQRRNSSVVRVDSDLVVFALRFASPCMTFHRASLMAAMSRLIGARVFASTNTLTSFRTAK